MESFLNASSSLYLHFHGSKASLVLLGPWQRSLKRAETVSGTGTTKARGFWPKQILPFEMKEDSDVQSMSIPRKIFVSNKNQASRFRRAYGWKEQKGSHMRLALKKGNYFHQSSLNVLLNDAIVWKCYCYEYKYPSQWRSSFLQPLSSPSSQHINRLIQSQQIEQAPNSRSMIIIMVIITTINFNIFTIIAIITIITTTVSSSPIKTLKKPPPCCAKVWEEGSCHEDDSCAENGVIWQLHHLHHHILHHHHQCNELNEADWEQFRILPNSVIWNSNTT